MKGLDYHERCRARRTMQSDAEAFALRLVHCAVMDILAGVGEPHRSVGARLIWRHIRIAAFAAANVAGDRLLWRERCHQINGRAELVKWPGGQATRHTVHLRERARCLLGGRDYPIAGPTGRLP